MAYNVHHGSAHQPKYSVSPVDTCAYEYEGGLVEEMMTTLLRLLHRKQTHVTRIPLKLQKRNNDFRTLHEQSNKMVYSLNQFETSFFEYWPNKNLQIFLCSMRNFTKYLKILLFSIRMLVRTSRVFAETVTYGILADPVTM